MGYKLDGKTFNTKEDVLKYIEQEQEMYKEEGYYNLDDFKRDIEEVIKVNKMEDAIQVTYINNEQDILVGSKDYITNLKFNISGKVNKDISKRNIDFVCKTTLKIQGILKEIEEIVQDDYTIYDVQVQSGMYGNTLLHLNLEITLRTFNNNSAEYIHLNRLTLRNTSDGKKDIENYLNHIRFIITKRINGIVSKDENSNLRIGSLDVELGLSKLVE